ncbi:3-deoxy-manno-octulosonate cytidylyltransferase [Blochmannia endosymbiont of Camponotus (Colobopsis) obliquus]|uniref:3-deoxy-manno-octulosonate cytidylyltransferase n=1 Tax=Blochmannia endosymbiont of Camponotus (Colobopsis) obliquus TaxID=1505597 RepID=UPI00061A54FE|nr:3-deoxy-manno-octulosonate cytidylyltransferase [Blochmannia endosymbiont of Camponotus (Colobopsis) obliquus]AKC60535.1 3-deoxy-manno-octulosonate cytidylyltransferase [Blochmannia endosymbiont of Camponotus (Colobopsis) obliquus]
MKFIVIIPARLSSKRLLNKPLININGKPMVIHVVEHAIASGADRVIVATDHLDVVKVIELSQSKGEVCLTKNNHKSGTERLEEVITYYGFSNSQIIVNVQGDEPLIPPKVINRLANSLYENNKINMVTAAVPINSTVEANNANVVKLVLDINNYALYFSRAVIPYISKYDFLCSTNKKNNTKLLRHVGIYSYRVEFIHRYVKWSPSPLEMLENLEQLRVLWYGEKIYVKIFNNLLNISVDSIEDLNKVMLFFKKQNVI